MTEREMIQQALLKESAETFRRYEAFHRAKGTAESNVKAEVNATLATKIEAVLVAQPAAMPAEPNFAELLNEMRKVLRLALMNDPRLLDRIQEIAARGITQAEDSPVHSEQQVAAFSCAKRAADPSNEFAACRQHCGDDAKCLRVSGTTPQPAQQSEPRAEFLALAESCGAVLTGKPDGSESVTVQFSIEAWRRFDSALLEERAVTSVNIGRPHVSFDEKKNVTLEWWCGDRKITMYPTDKMLLKVWGTKVSEMAEVWLEDRAATVAAFQWLASGTSTSTAAPAVAPDGVRAALLLAREYVENASQRMYDGTNGHGIREEAKRRLALIDAALKEQP